MEDEALSAHLLDPARLAALQAVALLDTPAEESFDRLTWLASRFLNAPTALVSLIDSDRQFFKSCLGLPEPWLSLRETPLSHSFCQHNRIPRQPLLIEDARVHPVFKDNPAIRDLKAIAYLGIPLATPDGYILGSFCVIDSLPRQWTAEDIEVVERLARSVMSEILLRTEIRSNEEMQQRLQAQHEELREAYGKLEQETAERLRALEQLRQRDRMLIQQGRLTAMGELISNIAHQWRQPLNIMALAAQELPMAYHRGAFSEEFLDATVHRIMQEIRHMSGTIDNFRTFFRPEKEKVPFCIAEAVSRTVALLGDALGEAGVKIETFTAAAPVVHGYPYEYSQVLLHIISNAKDALLARKVPSPRISIDIGCDDAGRSVVTVTDNAGGIPADVIDKVFEPYFTTKGPDKGTGLGLYMSKMIIENNMCGTLSVSNTDEGARFRIVV